MLTVGVFDLRSLVVSPRSEGVNTKKSRVGRIRKTTIGLQGESSVSDRADEDSNGSGSKSGVVTQQARCQYRKLTVMLHCVIVVLRYRRRACRHGDGDHKIIGVGIARAV